MKKIFGFAALLAVIFFACNKVTNTNQPMAGGGNCPCIDSPLVITTSIFKSNQNTILGTMKVWNDNSNIYVQITTPGKTFNKSQLYIGSCGTIPNNPSQYPNVINHNPNLETYTYVFPQSYNNCDQICINARLVGISNGGGTGDAALNYQIREICECDIQIGDFRTQSKGGWGAPPNGNNNGQYMHDNWNVINSLTIGCTGTTMTFTSAQSVTDYLPNGNGAAYPFDQNLATQVLALSVTIALDNGIPGFGASNCPLSGLVVDSPLYPAFNGMTVAQVLALANEVLGGCNNNYSFSDMNDIVEAINLNFHEGTVNEGILTCGDCN